MRTVWDSESILGNNTQILVSCRQSGSSNSHSGMRGKKLACLYFFMQITVVLDGATVPQQNGVGGFVLLVGRRALALKQLHFHKRTSKICRLCKRPGSRSGNFTFLAFRYLAWRLLLFRIETMDEAIKIWTQLQRRSPVQSCECCSVAHEAKKSSTSWV